MLTLKVAGVPRARGLPDADQGESATMTLYGIVCNGDHKTGFGSQFYGVIVLGGEAVVLLNTYY